MYVLSGPLWFGTWSLDATHLENPTKVIRLANYSETNGYTVATVDLPGAIKDPLRISSTGERQPRKQRERERKQARWRLSAGNRTEVRLGFLVTRFSP